MLDDLKGYDELEGIVIIKASDDLIITFMIDHEVFILMIDDLSRQGVF